jgi:phosphate transport system substrate-binding protein
MHNIIIEGKTMKYLHFCIVLLFITLVNSCFFTPVVVPSSVPDSINRYYYRPFEEKNKLVVLEEEAKLKLTDNLPIIDGATALYPLYAAFAQAVYPQGEYYPYSTLENSKPIVACSSTPNAFNKLIDGTVDLIFCAAPSANQIENAKKKGVTFNLIPIGKEAFVFFVNKRNPVSNLTTRQIRDIYSGRTTNWKQLGGKNISIKAYQRQKNSGSQTMLIAIMGDETIMKPSTKNTISFMLDIIMEVSEYKNNNNAIGYSFLFYTTQMVRNNKIKLLSINGITPSSASIQDGTYPYSENFYAITTNTKNENVNKFINWILSEQGQYLVRETGYVPLH